MFTVVPGDRQFIVQLDTLTILEGTVRRIIRENEANDFRHPYDKINAIKALRATYWGIGLRDAKEIVEAVAETLYG